MGRFDDCDWTEAEDFSVLNEVRFSDQLLIEIFKSLLEIYETEGL